MKKSASIFFVRSTLECEAPPRPKFLASLDASSIKALKNQGEAEPRTPGCFAQRKRLLLLTLLPFPLFATTTVDLDLLYWKPQENELTSSLDNAHAQSPDFHYTLGFRVGIEQTLPHDTWDIGLAWTRFHTHTENTHTGTLIPTWEMPIGSGGFVDEAHTHWRLHLGLIDLTLGKWICTSRDLDLRPYMGIRGAIVRHKYFITYVAEGEDVIHTKNKFAGIGPMGGLEIDYLLWRQLHLLTNASFSLPYGEIYVHQSEKATTGLAKRLGMHDCSNQMRPIFDFSLGLAWFYTFQKADFSLELSWDELFFFGQNQLKNFVNPDLLGKFTSNLGDLSLSGWTLSSRLYF